MTEEHDPHAPAHARAAEDFSQESSSPPTPIPGDCGRFTHPIPCLRCPPAETSPPDSLYGKETDRRIAELRTSPPERPIRDFANSLLGDWQHEMDDFFTKVEAKREKTDLTTDQVREALDIGYGSEVGDAWQEWLDD